jgi:hypothetical protein
MDLKNFVSETLRQIVDGINDAQRPTLPKDAVIVPYYEKLEKVEFDVAVTAVEGTETSGKASINVWSIGAGVSGKSESSTSTVSRIRFSVAVELPKGSQKPTTTPGAIPSSIPHGVA